MASPVEKKKKLSPADHRLISSAAIGENQQQKPGSIVTSYFGSKMKINLLRKIWICTDVLMDVFPFFDRPQLGLKLALISLRFEVLVDKHFDGKTELTIWRLIEIHKDDGLPKPKLFVHGKSEGFPLPDRPLPIKIRFKNLRIEYFDHFVIAFLRANKQIWDRSGTYLRLNVHHYNKDIVQPILNAFIPELWPIFAPNIRRLVFLDGDHLVAMALAPPAEKKKKHSSADHRSISSAAIGEKQQQKPGSVVTSSLGSKMKCHLRKIWLCSDVLMDILPFFGHAQLGLDLALRSYRFDVLVDKHFDGKSELPIWRTIRIDKMGTVPKSSVVTNFCANSVPFPLPDYPLPIKIRFNCIEISYIDHSVIAFLRANQRIWDRSGTKLDLYVSSIYKDFVQPIWNAFVAEIWPIFAPNIRHLILPNADHLDNLRRHISPTVLTDLNQLTSITIEFLYPDVTADDGPNATAGQALSKWLHTPTKDGQPKRLCCRFYSDPSMPIVMIENFREAFRRAIISSSACYTIHFYLRASFTIVPFELVNEVTQEKLTLEKDGNFEQIAQWVMKRFPIGKTVKWNDDNWDNLNGFVFRFYGGNDCIGPLYPPRAEEETGQSGEKSA